MNGPTPTPGMQGPPTPPMPGGAQAQGAMPGAGSDTGYPSGAEVMAAREGQDGMVENPVIAGFRSIIMLIGALEERGDPRAEPAKQALQSLLGTLGSGNLPMSPPTPAGPGAQAPGPGGQGPGGPMPGAQAPGGSPMPPTPGSQVPQPAPGVEVMSQFEQGAPSPMQKPRQIPMGKQQKQSGRQPVVLT